MTARRVIEICGKKVIDHKWKEQVNLQEICSQNMTEQSNIRRKIYVQNVIDRNSTK